MIEKLKEKLKMAYSKIRFFFEALYISTRFLLIIGVLSFIVISISVFIPNLTASNNVVTVRTLFSSIIGFILEISSKELICNDRITRARNYFVGIMAVLIMGVLIGAIIVNANLENPSLILLKNTLFSTVGFLISATKECESK